MLEATLDQGNNTSNSDTLKNTYFGLIQIKDFCGLNQTKAIEPFPQ